LVVLTEGAAEGTTAQKDSSGAIFTADGGLFTQVGLNRGDAQVGSFPAEAELIRGPVHTTAAWAELTGPVMGEERFFKGIQQWHGK
jgi:hypothetical protein